jgi:hypothetical protein
MRTLLRAIALVLVIAFTAVWLAAFLGCARPLESAPAPRTYLCIPRDTSAARRALDDDSGDMGRVIPIDEPCQEAA